MRTSVANGTFEADGTLLPPAKGMNKLSWSCELEEEAKGVFTDAATCPILSKDMATRAEGSSHSWIYLWDGPNDDVPGDDAFNLTTSTPFRAAETYNPYNDSTSLYYNASFTEDINLVNVGSLCF
ncbi:unnamed protein product [Cylicostephanus goldi]|uniref:SCP domain-containing protein n=1 Tax=Cylicostephanus goldi TaxID=71465 RepID=A0A3P6SR17_CYLGO|nr:unnamed protein product [Cylicostephanus goldi]